MNPKKVWTPVAVMRGEKLAFISVYVNYDESNDRFECLGRSWHRRGMPYFKTRRECVVSLHQSGKVLG